MAIKRFNLDESFNDVNAYIETPKETPPQIQPTSMNEPSTKLEEPKKSYTEPDKLFRRNITLSEEQFRRLEFIKKAKNKARSKDEDMITLDKLMFDMVQKCLDEQYPETKAMFDKYIKIKEMEDFGDLM